MHKQEFHVGIKGNIVSFYSCTEYSSGGATAIETKSRIIHTEFTDKSCWATACKSLLLNTFTLWTQTFGTALTFAAGGRTHRRRAPTPLGSQSRPLPRVVARWSCSGGLARNSTKSPGCPLISAAHCHVGAISHMLPANLPSHRPEPGWSSSRNTAPVSHQNGRQRPFAEVLSEITFGL